MKRETIITSIVTIVLNLIWSTIFDLLPNIVDFSIFSEIQVSKYLLLLPFLVVINVGMIIIFRSILKRAWEKETFLKQLESAINELIQEESSEIPERPPVMRPGEPQVFLKYYYDVLKQLNNLNGKIEFFLEGNPPSSFDCSKPLYLYDIRPGMSKYFMILTQNKEDLNAVFVIISPDYESTPQEFTYTWFNRIFPLIGNMSDKISAKEMSNQIESSGYYEIRKYEFIIRNGENFIRISVI